MCDKTSASMKEWIEVAFKDKNLSNYKIEIEGQTNKGDGFSGDMNFVKVSGTTKNGVEKIFHLAVKSSKDNEAFRAKTPTKKAYLKEIFIYEEVKPTFLEFLHSKGLEEQLEFLPQCHATLTTENNEVLLFENLRPQGFQLWDKDLPVTSKHIDLVLEAYGKWHAISIALKIQKPEVFKNLAKDNVNMFTYVVNKMKMIDTIVKEFANAKSVAIGADEKDILARLEFSENDVKNAFTDIFFKDPEHHVVLHGDCWNNNFVYKSSDDKTNPSEVRILDWQCSGLGSPAIDLAHFIYCCVDTGKNTDVKELLKIYYSTFSKYLTLLGCVPENVFPFDKLVEHWKQFSHFGLFLSCWVIRICLMKEDEMPDFAESATKNENVMDDFTFGASNDEKFIKRVRNNLLFYCKNVQ